MQDEVQRSETVIHILQTVAACRNVESSEHMKRVSGFTKILGKYLMEAYPEYGLTEEKVEIIAAASILHDIGKIAIPDRILLKPGKLTKDEYENMKSHTIKGSEIIERTRYAWEGEYERACYEICRYHHERYDGKGYPDGLRGEEIPLSAQLTAVADVYDALVSERAYKHACTKEDAFHMIMRGECGIFSPKLLDGLKNVKREFENFADETAVSV